MDLQDTKDDYYVSDGFRAQSVSLLVSVFFALLSFFIMINSISSNNQQKSSEISKSLKREFKDTSFKKELKIFSKREYDEGAGPSPLSFASVMQQFLAGNADLVESSLTETKDHYIVSVNSLNFFGPTNTTRRPNADKFLTTLNSFIQSENVNGSNATLIIYYDDTSPKNLGIVTRRIADLSNSLKGVDNKRINFSFIPLKTPDKEKLKNIEIYFNKNEF